MTTNIRPEKASGIEDVTFSLGESITVFLATRQNAAALLHYLENGQALGVEEYSDQKDDLIKALKKIVTFAPQVANLSASCIVQWNSAGGNPPHRCADFVSTKKIEDDPSSDSSIRNLLHFFKMTKHIIQVGNEINAQSYPIPINEKTKEDLLNTALHTAIEETHAAEQSFVEVKVKAGGPGLEEPMVKAAETRSQIALLTQIEAYNNVISAKALSAFGNAQDETFSFPGLPDISKFVNGAIDIIATGVKVVTVVANILI
ncbi:hypothetical protein DL96DRAFT_792322 [Flagelloscypha sp. PMI_526]|nr:hypothetical protein DL96DRAFT_792322 [Flagelloscypha sp. PMI_526]